VREEYVSRDGLLRFVVEREGDEITLGFDGYPWHTHGDVLVGCYALAGRDGLTPEQATRLFVSELTESRAVVAVLRVQRAIRDVWVTDDPAAAELQHRRPGEELAFRRWDATTCGAG